MSSYTEENLDKLLKKDLIATVLAMQPKMSANSAKVMEEIHKLNSKFDILQSDPLVIKKVNSEHIFPCISDCCILVKKNSSKL